MAKAVAAGYISGFGDGTVRPDEEISRIEVTAILVKIAKLPLSEDVPLLTEFVDYEEIPTWGRGFVSAKSGGKQTFTITYTLGADFNEGSVEFSLPEEIAFTAGQDKVMLNGVEKTLAEADTLYNGQKVQVTGITAQKGDKVSLTIYDKTIPESGPYFFKVRADADGKEKPMPTTVGAGQEFKAFLAFSEVDEERNIAENFVKAINRGDFQGVAELLAENVVFVQNYMDGYFDMYTSMEEFAYEMNYLMEYEGTLENDESTLIELSDNVWQVEGKANDYFTRLTAKLNPEDGFEGLGYTAKLFVTENKISYIELLWNREDEVLFDKLNEGTIGVFLKGNEEGNLTIRACIPGTPGEKAGLLPGDIVIAVNGVDFEDMDYGLEEARFRIMGKGDTKVKLTIERNGEVFDVEVERTAY